MADTGGIVDPGDMPGVMIAFAHAVDPALRMLEVTAMNPVQGEAMHKVIGWHAARALVQVGWLTPDGPVAALPATKGDETWPPVYVVRDPQSGRSDG